MKQAGVELMALSVAFASELSFSIGSNLKLNFSRVAKNVAYVDSFRIVDAMRKYRLDALLGLCSFQIESRVRTKGSISSGSKIMS
jgi:hypothetical protein